MFPKKSKLPAARQLTFFRFPASQTARNPDEFCYHSAPDLPDYSAAPFSHFPEVPLLWALSGNWQEQEVFSLYKEERDTKYNSNDFLKLFRHIKENQIFYQTYFKLNKDQNFNRVLLYDTNLSKVFFNDKYVDYHIEFFRAGLNAIIKKWLYNGCKEEPEEIDFIIKEEYKTKNFNF